MLKISICVGSSCHLKGAPKIVKLFQAASARNDLKKEVTLAASFCLGRCAEGVCVRIGDNVVANVSTENFNDIFRKYVMEAL